jgi:excisionase family DNA binding protein
MPSEATMTFAHHAEQLLHSPEESAVLLGVSRSQVFEMLARGEIESFKIGRLRKIPREAITDYIKRRRPAADAGRSVPA